MTAPTTTPEIARYRDAVRTALADLSAEDRDDLMEDVESHLTEVAAEDDGSLDRLGAPAEYAAELRTSAGLAAKGEAPRRSFWERMDAALANSALGRGVERVAKTPQGRSLRAFLPELRPGWWVLRGYLVALVITMFFGFSPAGPFPQVGSSVVLGLLFALVTIWGSVRLGRYAQAHQSLRPWILAGTVLLLFLTLFGVALSDPYGGDDTGQPAQEAGLVGVSNVYVYDSEGRPLTSVQLFDQEGNPLQVFDSAYDANGLPVDVRRYYDPDGLELYNIFPRETATGAIPRPLIIAPRLAPTAVPSVAPSPGATASPGPSGGAAVPSATPSPR